MEQKFLIDTNVVIDYFGCRLPPRGEAFLDDLPPLISVITRIELLGWHAIKQKQLNKLLAFVANADVLHLDEPVVEKTILLRQKHKIKTPDAIIAATAIVNKLTLVTRNTSDFKQIPALKLFNPFDKK